MSHPALLPRARTARIAVSALFFVNGAGFASILPRLPAIKESLGLSNAELGLAIAAMPVGGLLAGGFAGLLIARFGSGRTAAVAGTAAALMVAGVGLAPSWALLALAYLVLGAFDATMDAAMNAHGLGVERQYGRSLLQGFHGSWSAGSMTGGAVGAIAAVAGVPVPVQAVVVAPVLAAIVLVASRGLLPARIADAHPPGDVADEPIHVRNAPRLLRVLGPIAMLGILCAVLQGTAATWSAVFLTDVLQTSAGIAATGFVVYMASMTLGRLTNDRWIDRFGGVAVVRAGALIGAAGVGARHHRRAAGRGAAGIRRVRGDRPRIIPDVPGHGRGRRVPARHPVRARRGAHLVARADRAHLRARAGGHRGRRRGAGRGVPDPASRRPSPSWRSPCR